MSAEPQSQDTKSISPEDIDLEIKNVLNKQLHESDTRVHVHFEDLCFPVILSYGVSKISDLKRAIKTKAEVSYVPELKNIDAGRLEIIHDLSFYSNQNKTVKADDGMKRDVAQSLVDAVNKNPNEEPKYYSSLKLGDDAYTIYMEIVNDCHLTMRILTPQEYEEYLAKTMFTTNKKPKEQQESCCTMIMACICCPCLVFDHFCPGTCSSCRNACDCLEDLFSCLCCCCKLFA